MGLRIRSLRFGQKSLGSVEIDCSASELLATAIRCRGGRFRVAGKELPLRADFRFDAMMREIEFSAWGPQGARLDARLEASGRLHARLASVDIEDIARHLPPLPMYGAAWKPAGVVHGEVEWSEVGARRPGDGRLTLNGRIAKGGFGSADGQRAAENLEVALSLDARRASGGWTWRTRADWQRGEAYWHPFFVAAGIGLTADGTLRGDRLVVRQLAARLEGVDALAARGTFDLGRGRMTEGAFSIAGADLAVIGPRWVAPLVAPAAAERLRFAGRVSAGVRFEDGVLRAVDAVFDDAGFSLPGAAGGGVAFGPLSGRVPWDAVAATRAELQIGGGRWEKLELGPFSLSARLQADRIAFDRSAIPLLDGALVLDGLALRRVEDTWMGSGRAAIEPVSMRLLTAALGLPVMGGVLSASIPALSVRPGEVMFDGALVISLFDGYLQATNLRVREPFGVASRLSADVEARHIDLAQLTETFSFGSITGFADADVRGLELLRWQPTRFDARVASSPGSYPRRISQRAVQNISALSGGGAAAAIQRSMIGLFDTFGYRELGFRCVLDANVCTADGIDGRSTVDGGFVIVRGGGVPALDVIGYNRRIDWKELVDRVQRVVKSKVAPEVR